VHTVPRTRRSPRPAPHPAAFLLRDLPFDAIEFLAYEQLRLAAIAALASGSQVRERVAKGRGAAGCLAPPPTQPLDWRTNPVTWVLCPLCSSASWRQPQWARSLGASLPPSRAHLIPSAPGP